MEEVMARCVEGLVPITHPPRARIDGSDGKRYEIVRQSDKRAG